MKIAFSKYHGAGNDFIMIDNRELNLSLVESKVAWLCNRKLGIGADGLILLSDSEDFDFEMKYYNSDGKEGTMCGNGGRCITSFAKALGVIGDTTRFIAIDGSHEAVVLDYGKDFSNISVKLNDVKKIVQKDDYFLINTGSPHYVKFVDKMDQIDIFNEGKRIRSDKEFQPEGVNVNFVQRKDDRLVVRTFERGVENITLSCGTGVTASAIATSIISGGQQAQFDLETFGGVLSVRFQIDQDTFKDIWLDGPVEKVFEGVIEI